VVSGFRGELAVRQIGGRGVIRPVDGGGTSRE
jgi:hypothetical protein